MIFVFLSFASTATVQAALLQGAHNQVPTIMMTLWVHLLTVCMMTLWVQLVGWLTIMMTLRVQL